MEVELVVCLLRQEAFMFEEIHMVSRMRSSYVSHFAILKSFLVG